MHIVFKQSRIEEPIINSSWATIPVQHASFCLEFEENNQNEKTTKKDNQFMYIRKKWSSTYTEVVGSLSSH